MRFIIKILSTVCFIGYIPFASGTFGSLVGAIIWVLFSTWQYYIVIVVFIVIIGFFTANYAEKNIFKRLDPPEVVIDEVSGVLISFIMAKFLYNIKSVIVLVLGFAIFRFFDILKPQPIRVLQRLPGGIGIMIDDIIAGVFTSIILFILKFLFNL